MGRLSRLWRKLTHKGRRDDSQQDDATIIRAADGAGLRKAVLVNVVDEDEDEVVRRVLDWMEGVEDGNDNGDDESGGFEGFDGAVAHAAAGSTGAAATVASADGEEGEAAGSEEEEEEEEDALEEGPFLGLDADLERRAAALGCCIRKAMLPLWKVRERLRGGPSGDVDIFEATGLQIETKPGLAGIYVRTVERNSLASVNGVICVGDRVVAANGVELLHATLSEAEQAFGKASQSLMRLVVMAPVVESDLHTVVVQRGSDGLGFSVASYPNQPGVYVQDLMPGGPADQTGSIYRGDRIVMVNDMDVIYASHWKVVHALTSRDQVKIVFQDMALPLSKAALS